MTDRISDFLIQVIGTVLGALAVLLTVAVVIFTAVIIVPLSILIVVVAGTLAALGIIKVVEEDGEARIKTIFDK